MTECSFEAKKHASKNEVRATSVPGGVMEMLVGDRWMLIDEADLPLLGQYRWSLTCGRTGDLYARAYAGGGRKAGKFVRAHRLLLNPPPDLDVDHINRNTLDNRRSNLRAVTRSQNLYNGDLPSHNTSGVRGVRWYGPYSKWVAYANVRGKRKTIGYFADIGAATAARAAFLSEIGL